APRRDTAIPAPASCRRATPPTSALRPPDAIRRTGVATREHRPRLPAKPCPRPPQNAVPRFEIVLCLPPPRSPAESRCVCALPAPATALAALVPTTQIRNLPPAIGSSARTARRPASSPA